VPCELFSPKPPERQGKKDWGENLGGFGTNYNFFKYPEFSKNIFPERLKIVEKNEECFETILWNLLFVFKLNSQN
jgi:hypothetical protein